MNKYQNFDIFMIEWKLDSRLHRVVMKVVEMNVVIIGKELNTSFEVDVETIDDEEHAEHHFQCVDEVEIVGEFKSGPSISETTNDRPKSYKNNKFIYCSQCKNSWKYESSKKEKNCLKCKSMISYQCGKCCKIYPLIKSLNNHLSLVCKKKFKFHCDHCQFETVRKSTLTLHIQAKHLPKKINLNKCNLCGKNFLTKSYLRRHMKLCGQPKTSESSRIWFVCDYCQHKTNTKAHLSDHIQAKHLPRDPNLHRCEKCGKSYSNQNYLYTHSKLCDQVKDSKPASPSLSCSHCNYMSNFKNNLASHIKTKHLPKDPDANKCKKCGKSYSSFSNLWKHLQLCGKPKNSRPSLPSLSCGHCKYKTDHKQNLERHIQTKHQPRDHSLNKCKICGKSYSSQPSLKKHLKICGQSNDIKKFSCDHCDFKCTQKVNLASHIFAIHLRDQNSNKCKKCKKSYAKSSYLKEHLKICGKSENSKCFLMRISCDLCDYKCKTKHQIVSHIQSKHLPVNPNKCKGCAKIFAATSSLKTHLKTCAFIRKI